MLTIVDVNFDRSEMLLQVSNGKTVSTQQFTSDKINRIQFGLGTVKSWFSKKTLPKVEIYLKGKEEPFVLQSGQTKLNFDQASNVIRQYAEKNDVPLME